MTFNVEELNRMIELQTKKVMGAMPECNSTTPLGVAKETETATITLDFTKVKRQHRRPSKREGSFGKYWKMSHAVDSVLSGFRHMAKVNLDYCSNVTMPVLQAAVRNDQYLREDLVAGMYHSLVDDAEERKALLWDMVASCAGNHNVCPDALEARFRSAIDMHSAVDGYVEDGAEEADWFLKIWTAASVAPVVNRWAFGLGLISQDLVEDCASDSHDQVMVAMRKLIVSNQGEDKLPEAIEKCAAIAEAHLKVKSGNRQNEVEEASTERIVQLLQILEG